jgi:hypothetical protein
MTLTLELLENIEENTNSLDLKNIMRILLASMNDWPIEIRTLEDFEVAIGSYLKSDVNVINIKKKLAEKDFIKFAWQSESLYQMLELYDYYPQGLSLLEIMDKIKEDIGNI